MEADFFHREELLPDGGNLLFQLGLRRDIAGIQPAWAQWKLFMGEEKPPKYEKHRIGAFRAHQEDLSILVRAEACIWLAELLNGLFEDPAEFRRLGREPK